MYDAVVFDNDGVLTERTDRAVLREAARAAFESFDVDPAASTLDEMVAGVDPAWVERICGAHGLDVDAFWRERDDQFSKFQCQETEAGRKPAYEDVAALDALADRGVTMGVVSNNQYATIDHLFAYHDLHGYFETWYGREPTMESVRRKKPEPHYVERALDDLDVDAGAALYVGDKASDVRAAHAAGADAALVRRDHNRDVSPDPSPTHVVESLHAIPPLLDQ